MRFKAKLRTDQVSLLSQIVAPLSRLQDAHQKAAVLYLDDDYLRISCKSNVHCFSELSQKEIFLEHRIESAANNVICLQLDLNNFKQALQSVVVQHQHHNARSSSRLVGRTSLSGGLYTQQDDGGATLNIRSLELGATQNQIFTLKLAKRQGMPCLCLEGRHTLMDNVEIHQALPVRVLRSSELQYHLPPQINRPTVQLELPSRPALKGVVEKLKTMGKQLFLEASMKGDLTLRLDQDGASLACFYHGLQPHWPDEEDEDDLQQHQQQQSSSSARCVLKVDAGQLAHCLQWQSQYSPIQTCLLGMIPNEMLVLHIVLSGQVGFFTYYLPVYVLQDGEQQEHAGDMDAGMDEQ